MYSMSTETTWNWLNSSLAENENHWLEMICGGLGNFVKIVVGLQKMLLIWSSCFDIGSHLALLDDYRVRRGEMMNRLSALEVQVHEQKHQQDGEVDYLEKKEELDKERYTRTGCHDKVNDLDLYVICHWLLLLIFVQNYVNFFVCVCIIFKLNFISCVCKHFMFCFFVL